MQGIAILINVFPDDVNDCLKSVDCFEHVLSGKDEVKIVQMRMLLQNARVNKKRAKWLRDSHFGVALMSWSRLTPELAAQCEKEAGEGKSINGSKSIVLWLANDSLPENMDPHTELDLTTFMTNAQPSLVDKIGIGLKLLQEASHKKRRINNICSQFDGAKLGYVAANASSASQVPLAEIDHILLSDVGKWLLNGVLQDLRSTLTIRPGLDDTAQDSKGLF